MAANARPLPFTPHAAEASETVPENTGGCSRGREDQERSLPVAPKVEEAPKASELAEIELLQNMGLDEIEEALRAVLGPLAEAAPAASEPAVSSPDAQTLPVPRWVTAATPGGTASVEERGGQRHQYGPWRSKRQWERVIKNKHRKRGRK